MCCHNVNKHGINIEITVTVYKKNIPVFSSCTVCRYSEIFIIAEAATLLFSYLLGAQCAMNSLLDSYLCTWVVLQYMYCTEEEEQKTCLFHKLHFFHFAKGLPLNKKK